MQTTKHIVLLSAFCLILFYSTSALAQTAPYTVKTVVIDAGHGGKDPGACGKISKEKFMELKQDAEYEIEAFRQTKAEKEKELAVVQEELQQKKQIAGNTEVLLTADNLQQYVKKIEVDHKKNTYTEFVF